MHKSFSIPQNSQQLQNPCHQNYQAYSHIPYNQSPPHVSPCPWSHHASIMALQGSPSQQWLWKHLAWVPTPVKSLKQLLNLGTKKTISSFRIAVRMILCKARVQSGSSMVISWLVQKKEITYIPSQHLLKWQLPPQAHWPCFLFTWPHPHVAVTAPPTSALPLHTTCSSGNNNIAGEIPAVMFLLYYDCFAIREPMKLTLLLTAAMTSSSSHITKRFEAPLRKSWSWSAAATSACASLFLLMATSNSASYWCCTMAFPELWLGVNKAGRTIALIFILQEGGRLETFMRNGRTIEWKKKSKGDIETRKGFHHHHLFYLFNQMDR